MNAGPGRDLAPKVLFLKFTLWALFGLFACRLFYLQVMRGDYYRALSENNYTRNIVLRAPRGMIVDRKGEVLCRNRVSFSLLFDLTRSGDPSATLAAMERILGYPMTRDDFQAALKRSPVPSLAVIARDIPISWVQKVEARQAELPHLTIEMELRREYPYGSLLCHSLGYVGLISEDESRSMNIPLTDPFLEVGKTGVEKSENPLLMGRNGRRTAQVNSLGREVDDPTLRLPGLTVREEALPGTTVKLTLDIKLQRLLETAFGEETGTALFMDPATGEILAWVSVPGFDPNVFTSNISAATWKALSEDPRHPLLNRPIQGAYPPGSSFKPFVALVGLEEGKLTPSTVYSCGGVWVYGGNPFHCWSKGHGGVDLLTAIQNSCNIYFYHAGDAIGIDRLARWGARFGLGKPTGVDLPAEGSGVLPSSEWKASRKLGPWYPGETLSVSIGQGYLTVTPMQLLSFYATLATGGVRMRPHLAQAFPEVLQRTDVSPSSLALVKEGLWRVVNGGGTGKACRIEGLDVCAKTGTAQVVKASAGKNTYSLDKSERDHAWFAGFAPREDPKVAFVVLVEHGGHGGDVAAKITRVGLEYLFFGKEPDPAAAVPTPTPPPAGPDPDRDQARLTPPEVDHAGAH